MLITTLDAASSTSGPGGMTVVGHDQLGGHIYILSNPE